MRKAPLVPLALLTIVVLAIGKPLYDQADQTRWERQCPQKAYLSLRLTETPCPRTKSLRATAEVTAVDGHPCHGDITVYLRRDSTAATLRYGDRLLLHGFPDSAKRTVYSTSDHYIVTSQDTQSLRSRIETLRMHLLHRMQAGPLEPRYAGVAEAMTLGWRGDLDPSLQSAYRDSGIIHLLCVSGLHVGLLAAIVGRLLVALGKERKGRIARGCVQLTAIWCLVLLTGFAPATLRAALMFSMFIISSMLARRTDSLNLLAAAAIIMLTAKPSLLFDTGWQLSFSAVTAILLARPVIRCFHSRLLQGAAVSTAATLGTLPVVVATFHRIPLYFIIANVVIVPLSSLLLLCSLCYLALPSSAFACPLRLLLQVTDTVTAWVSSLPHAVVEGIHLPPIGLVLLSLAVLSILLSASWITKKQEKARLPK